MAEQKKQSFLHGAALLAAATAIVKAVREREKGGYVLTLETFCENQRGERVIEGEAVVLYEEPEGQAP